MYARCPTRLIVLGEIRISRISATPGDCPGQWVCIAGLSS
jgi:hypothetical protein